MAIRKEPARRYATVDELSNDIERYLDGRPVRARGDTFRYRSSKFVQRHKVAVAAAVLVAASLVGGLVTTNLQRARAERRFNDVRQLANVLMFEIHDAIVTLPGATRARELLVKTSLQYLDSLSQDAGSDLTLRRELARAYQKVGDIQGYPYEANLGDSAGRTRELPQGARDLGRSRRPRSRRPRERPCPAHQRGAHGLGADGDRRHDGSAGEPHPVAGDGRAAVARPPRRSDDPPQRVHRRAEGGRGAGPSWATSRAPSKATGGRPSRGAPGASEPEGRRGRGGTSPSPQQDRRHPRGPR